MRRSLRWMRRTGQFVAVGGAVAYFAHPDRGAARRASARAWVAGLVDPVRDDAVGRSSYDVKAHAPAAADEAAWAAPLTPPDLPDPANEADATDGPVDEEWAAEADAFAALPPLPREPVIDLREPSAPLPERPNPVTMSPDEVLSLTI